MRRGPRRACALSADSLTGMPVGWVPPRRGATQRPEAARPREMEVVVPLPVLFRGALGLGRVFRGPGLGRNRRAGSGRQRRGPGALVPSWAVAAGRPPRSRRLLRARDAAVPARRPGRDLSFPCPRRIFGIFQMAVPASPSGLALHPARRKSGFPAPRGRSSSPGPPPAPAHTGVFREPGNCRDYH